MLPIILLRQDFGSSRVPSNLFIISKQQDLNRLHISMKNPLHSFHDSRVPSESDDDKQLSKNDPVQSGFSNHNSNCFMRHQFRSITIQVYINYADQFRVPFVTSISSSFWKFCSSHTFTRPTLCRTYLNGIK